jgi:hypothetical protein
MYAVCPSESLQQGSLIEIGDLTPVVAPFCSAVLLDQSQCGIIAVHRFRVAAGKVVRTAEIVENLHLILGVLRTLTQKQRCFQCALGRQVLAHPDLGDPLVIQRVRLTASIAYLLVYVS